jgi:3-phenylpropionate/trans-cinnamate dioxygenase ferredoxin reductase component
VATSLLNNIVIVGASLSGVRTAQALRSRGFAGNLVLLGDEGCSPYDRPPLSKSYLEGKRTSGQLSLSPQDPDLEALGVDFRAFSAVDRLNVSEQTVSLRNGSTIAFDGLVIASGARARTLLAANPLDERIHCLRTLADADRLRPALVPDARIVVIGAGFIGAEVASTARSLGAQVTVVEALPVPLSRQLGEAMGAAVAAFHQASGTRLICGATVNTINASGVLLSDGQQLDADVNVVGVGVQPNIEWLADSGLTLTNGVLCNESLQTMVDGRPSSTMVAVGDIACWTNPRYAYEGPVRVEHWTNAVESAEHAAATLLGDPQPFAPVPYFWSDQYAKKIQFLGRTAQFDEVRVVAGDVQDKFLALYRRNDQLVAALGVSHVKALMGYRQRLLDGCSWDEALLAAPQ